MTKKGNGNGKVDSENDRLDRGNKMGRSRITERARVTVMGVASFAEMTK